MSATEWVSSFCCECRTDYAPSEVRITALGQLCPACMANKIAEQLAQVADLQAAAMKDAKEHELMLQESAKQAKRIEELESQLDTNESIDQICVLTARVDELVVEIKNRDSLIESLFEQRDGLQAEVKGLRDAMTKADRLIGMNEDADSIEASSLLEAAISETCEHGKGKSDYCEPCGRIHGG